MSLNSNFFKNILDNFNFATLLLAALGATAALWLNNQYVSNEVYVKDKELIILKIESLEKEAQTLRFMIGQNRNDIDTIEPLILKLEILLSNFITDDGKIITQQNIIELEKSIAEIKRDIEYIKKSIMK
tara:strand:- start:3574 stop:3960 length:387 start_codon:yes stop_codon:yes gene_type:complete